MFFFIYKIVGLLLLFAVFTSCSVPLAMIPNLMTSGAKSNPGGQVAVEKGAIEKIIEENTKSDSLTLSYKFTIPDLIVCRKTPDAHVCVTANTKQRFLVSLQDWEDKNWDVEMVYIDQVALSFLFSEMRRLCQQNFSPQLECEKNLETAEFLENNLLEGGLP